MRFLRRSVRKSEAARIFGVSLSSVKRYVLMAREGKSLSPKKRPGLKSKPVDGHAVDAEIAGYGLRARHGR